MKFLKMPVVAAFACALCFGFSTKTLVPLPNCIVIDDICCPVSCDGGSIDCIKTPSGNLPVTLRVRETNFTKVTVTVKDSATSNIVFTEAINLKPQQPKTKLLNMSVLKKNGKYRLFAMFKNTNNTGDSVSVSSAVFQVR
jgi:hypothetical protein